MSDFVNHKYGILVSTIVIEVGIKDVPNAIVMAIEHAEWFGLAQLQQIRSRIGRSTYQSYCLFLGIQKSLGSRQRTQTMLDTNDGFKIADVINGYDIIKLARVDVFELAKDGRTLSILCSFSGCVYRVNTSGLSSVVERCTSSVCIFLNFSIMVLGVSPGADHFNLCLSVFKQ